MNHESQLKVSLTLLVRDTFRLANLALRLNQSIYLTHILGSRFCYHKCTCACVKMCGKVKMLPNNSSDLKTQARYACRSLYIVQLQLHSWSSRSYKYLLHG